MTSSFFKRAPWVQEITYTSILSGPLKATPSLKPHQVSTVIFGKGTSFLPFPLGFWRSPLQTVGNGRAIDRTQLNIVIDGGRFGRSKPAGHPPHADRLWPMYNESRIGKLEKRFRKFVVSPSQLSPIQL
ncbi:hypothetical protein Pst134EB_026358 [Puccinia striiformis f. sp. tritici]|nr:hypothetical protein Pst134EB_026358 [Puccinia striiformis f. sp. tritici]